VWLGAASAIFPANEEHSAMSAASNAIDVRKYSRMAGILFLLSMVGGFFGEFYAPSKLIVTGDAGATAANIIAHSSMFRWSFAAYLLEAICDIGLAWIMYVILRPVRKDVALLAAFFGLVSTAVFAGAELFYFAASFILGGADYLKTFSPDQVNTLGLLSLKFYGAGAGVFMAFYGIATFIRGYLIYQSDFLPKTLGILAMIAGVGFIVKNFTLIVVPAYSTDLFLAPMFIAGLSLTVWFLTKGVDVSRWEARAAA
jgi:hypothetical protein